MTKKLSKRFLDFKISLDNIQKFLDVTLKGSDLAYELCNPLSADEQHIVGKYREWDTEAARKENKGRRTSAGQDVYLFKKSNSKQYIRIKFDLRPKYKVNNRPFYSLPVGHNSLELGYKFITNFSLHFCLVVFKGKRTETTDMPMFANSDLEDDYLNHPLAFWSDKWENVPIDACLPIKKNQRRVDAIGVLSEYYKGKFKSIQYDRQPLVNRLLELINNEYK